MDDSYHNEVLPVVIDNADSEEGDSEKEENVHYTPRRKIKAPSPVWEHGGVKVEGGSKCGLCNKFFKSETSNTSNLIQHILKAHKDTNTAKNLSIKLEQNKNVREVKKVEKEKKKAQKRKLTQTSMFNFTKKSKPIDPVKKRKIDNSLIEYVIVENQPLSLVEKSSFRKLMYTAEPSYKCPSRRTFTSKVDSFAQEISKKLKEEVLKDLSDVDFKSVHITSDHGTSHDRFRSHRNVVTLARCTKNFELKTDVIAVIKCNGSQTGDVIRKDIKIVLDSYGRDETWIVNWVTDGEAKQVSARTPGKHPRVGLVTHLTASCVDHTAHLAAEDALSKTDSIKESTVVARDFINAMKDSHLMREAFNDMVIEAGDDPLAIIKGTMNRWYYRFLEIERLILMQHHVEKFQEEYENMPNHCRIDLTDWENLKIYVTSLKSLSDASTVMEGQKYPTASSVIPFLDQVFSNLESYITKLAEDKQAFPKCLLENMKKRFPLGLKNTVPFNFLNCLDPRYMDIYLNDDQVKKVVDDMYIDPLYDNATGEVVQNDEPGSSALPTVPATSSDTFSIRRAQLLAAKMVSPISQRTHITSKEKLQMEFDKYLQLRGSVSLQTNPLVWWKERQKEFPILARFFRAYCPFPATNTSSERVFNMEGQVVTSTRKRLDPERAEMLVKTRDYILQRFDQDAYTLCDKCPMPPNNDSSYVFECVKHQSGK